MAITPPARRRIRAMAARIRSSPRLLAEFRRAPDRFLQRMGLSEDVRREMIREASLTLALRNDYKCVRTCENSCNCTGTCCWSFESP